MTDIEVTYTKDCLFIIIYECCKKCVIAYLPYSSKEGVPIIELGLECKGDLES